MARRTGNIQPQLDLEEHADISGVPGKKVFNVDSSGNVVNFETITITQNVIADPNNSSTTNLTSGETFVGTSSSTLGVVGLQWSLCTTQNCTVYIEQSPDNTNWDISYMFDYIASLGGQGETVQATQSYWRIRVTNEGALTTTSFRLQGVLCPIATPLPSSLSQDARLKTESTLTGSQNTTRHAWISSTNTLGVNTTTRLVGTNFDGTTKDTNFWTETVTNGGTVTQSGEIQLDTNTNGTGGNGTAKYVTTQSARFVASSPLQFLGAFKWVTAGTTNNVRRCGAYNTTDGFYFELDGTTFSIGHRKASSDTLVSTGSFNGNYGASFTPTADTYYKLDIEWTPLATTWYVNNKKLHTASGGHLSNILTLPITFENNNSSALDDDIAFDCLGTAIIRQGEFLTSPTSYYHATGTTAGVNLKIGAGNLHMIILSNVINNSVITISDSITTTTPTIFALTSGAQAQPLTIDMGGLSFSTGLRLTVATQNASVVVVYE